jgi:hypothetical protein
MKNDPSLPAILERREFVLSSLLAMLSGVTITISGCDDESSPTTPPTPTPTATPTADETGSISGNHGHTATITGAQLAAGNDLTVQLTTGEGHTHSVSLTGAEVVQIRGNMRVSKDSTTDAGHSHTVTFN